MKLLSTIKGLLLHQTVYGPPPVSDHHDPENDVPEDIYGPPEMLGALGLAEDDPANDEPKENKGEE